MFVFKSFLFRLFVPFFLICVSSFIYGQEEFNQSYTREWGTYSLEFYISIDNNVLWLSAAPSEDQEEFISTNFITPNAQKNEFGSGNIETLICKLSSDGELL